MTNPSALSVSDLYKQTQDLIDETQRLIEELSPRSQNYFALKMQYENQIHELQKSMDSLRVLEVSTGIPRATFRWRNVVMLIVLSLLAGAVMVYFS